jgi:hypothetical protein
VKTGNGSFSIAGCGNNGFYTPGSATRELVKIFAVVPIDTC